MTQGEGGLFQQVASAVSQRLKAMEAADEPGVMDYRDIILGAYRRVAVHRPHLPARSDLLRSLIDAEIERAIKEDREAWAAMPPTGDRPSTIVSALLERGMRVEAIKRYRLETGSGLWDARTAVAAFGRDHGRPVGKK